MIMQHCPRCKTDSIPGDMVCLNCGSHWKFVTTYTKRSKIFIVLSFLAVLTVSFSITFFTLSSLGLVK